MSAQRGCHLNLSPITPACVEDGLQVGKGGAETCGEALVTASVGGDPKVKVRSKAGARSSQTLGVLPEERCEQVGTPQRCPHHLRSPKTGSLGGDSELVRVQRQRAGCPRQSEKGPVSARGAQGSLGLHAGRRHTCGG